MTDRGPSLTVRSPGRVNLIGDHTDYTGGLVLPMAIDRYTVIDAVRGGDRIRLSSADEPGTVDLPLNVADPRVTEPAWGRYVAGVVAALSPAEGLTGAVSTNIPIGAGLSSSAALEVGVALALGATLPPVELAEVCRHAEHLASGVPCGIMDQLCVAAGVDGHALMIDCHSLDITTVPIPSDLEVVVWSVAHRTLIGSPYAERVAECAAAEREIGPLRLADTAAVATLADPLIRSRALHVVNENERVRQFAAALQTNDRALAGQLMVEAHRSLAELYDTSTSGMDAAVEQLCATPGVWGARMTGGGFGGCVVALAEPGALPATDNRWVVRPVGGAHIAA